MVVQHLYLAGPAPATRWSQVELVEPIRRKASGKSLPVPHFQGYQGPRTPRRGSWDILVYTKVRQGYAGLVEKIDRGNHGEYSEDGTLL